MSRIETTSFSHSRNGSLGSRDLRDDFASFYDRLFNFADHSDLWCLFLTTGVSAVATDIGNRGGVLDRALTIASEHDGLERFVTLLRKYKDSLDE